MSMVVFCVVSLHRQCEIYPEDASGTFLRNVGDHLLVCTPSWRVFAWPSKAVRDADAIDRERERERQFVSDVSCPQRNFVLPSH
jgi:hypothetical protein